MAMKKRNRPAGIPPFPVVGAMALLFLFSVLTGCQERSPRNGGYQGIPTLIRGGVVFPSGGVPATANPTLQRDIKEITSILRGLVEMTAQKDFSKLPALVSPRLGLYVDLKAHKSYPDLLKEIEKKEGYFHSFYFDTESLRRETQDSTQLSVRDVLLRSGSIRIDFFFDSGGGQCEVRFHLEKNPGEEYRLNNPLFIRESGEWKLLRLF
jgi:hypothetical protein